MKALYLPFGQRIETASLIAPAKGQGPSGGMRRHCAEPAWPPDAAARPRSSACVTGLLALLLALALPSLLEAQLSYTTNNGAITITGYSGCDSGSNGAVVIPDAIDGLPVTSIQDRAFYDCTGLTSVAIPGSVTNIGAEAFAFCNVSAVAVDPQNPVYSDVNGVLFDKGQTTLVEYPGGACGSYAIPGGVTSIGDSAFARCICLYGVTIPDSVTFIGNSAFSNCLGLASVSLGSNVTSIGASAFEECWSLTGVTLPDSVTSIGASAFAACSGLTNLTVPDNVTSIGASAFQDCAGLTNVTIGNGVTNIGDHAFDNCGRLTGMTIPDSVTIIGDYAFLRCGGLTGVTLPDSVTSIGDDAFDRCYGLTNVTIPDSVTSIGDSAFENCGGLAGVTIPGSVTSIGAGAFEDCGGLTAIAVDAQNAFYSSVNGVLFNQSHTTLVEYPAGLPGSYAIPNGVTSIGDYAFADCGGLTNVTLPNSVTSIGDYAFSGCDGLTTVTLPNSVTSIGDYAFADCGGLTNVTLPNSVTSIGDYAFSGCDGLTSVTIPSSVTRIGEHAFDCFSLSAVYFEGNAPSGDLTVFEEADSGYYHNVTVYYLPGTTGWGSTFGGVPTAAWTLPYPLILNNGPGFGVQANGFSFTISWATNIPVVVEASTNLANPVWTPVATNTLSGGLSYFTDAQWRKYPRRFYRITSP
jgi:hypothetical protein